MLQHEQIKARTWSACAGAGLSENARASVRQTIKLYFSSASAAWARLNDRAEVPSCPESKTIDFVQTAGSAQDDA